MFAVLVLLAGCSATSAKTHAKRGVSGIEIDCSGLGNKWAKCEKRECKAQRYKVVWRSSEAKDEEGDYLFGWNPAGAVTRKMLVVCK